MTAENAIPAIHRILRHEGGFADHPLDPGGATNMGITLETFRRYIKPGATVDDLKAMRKEQAVIVYKRHYWDEVLADFLPSGLDYAVADFAVNSGPSRAVRFLQALIGAEQDGIVGPETLAAVARYDPERLADALCTNRLTWLRGLGTWPTFGRGWTARVEDVRRTAREWADDDPNGAPTPKGQTWLKRLIDALKGLF